MKPAPRFVLCVLSCLAAAPPAFAANTVVRVATPLGDFDIELCSELSDLCLGVAPNTVANFLSYVDSGAYVDSFIHRRVQNFVIQGGSFTADHVSLPPAAIDNHGVLVANEFNQSNERGTVAVPLQSDPPGTGNPCDTDENSGSSGWFVSVVDNSGLDCGLFTVFGVVVEPGMEVVDAINALQALNFGLGPSPRTADYPCNPNAQQQCTTDPVPYLIYTDVTRVPEPGVALGALVAWLALSRLRQRGSRG